MYDVHGVCKCMMYIERSVYKWDPRIETWDWSCRPAVSFYQNLDRAAKKDTKTENLLKSDPAGEIEIAKEALRHSAVTCVV